MENKYKNTIKSYKKLGETYVKSIKNLTPPQFNIFIKEVLPRGKVLDVGCAGGRDSKKLVQERFDVVGIDVVNEFLDVAKRDVPKAKFFKMDLLKLKFPKDYFDGIWANAILLHINKKDVPVIIKNFYKILKPKGKLFIGVKVGKGTTYNVDKLSHYKRLMVLFTKKQIKDFLKKYGFKIIYVKILPDDAGRKDIKWLRLIAEKI